MSGGPDSLTFISYSREDATFALTLAKQLRSKGAEVWVDQLDIKPGQIWDRAIEDALSSCSKLLVVLSPASVNSSNVMDEVSLALEERKTIIPVMYQDCKVPFRLRRLQYLDFRVEHDEAFAQLLEACGVAARTDNSPREVTPEKRIHYNKALVELSDALRSSYISAPQLDQFLRTRLDRRFDDLTSRYLPLSECVAQIVQKAHEQGWLHDLIREAAQDRPNNPTLRTLRDGLSES